MLPVRRNENWLPEMFNDFFDTNWMARANSTAPAVNVLDTDKSYEVELAAPGHTKEDFKISLDGEGNLVIDMEKKFDNNAEKKHGRYLRREFSYSKFQQVLTLPEDADREKIEAKVEDGVLSVSIPKIVKTKDENYNKVIEIK